ncbi:MAG: hypothetical protein ACLPKB_31725 [Xanthobacteraceae bacterium]
MAEIDSLFRNEEVLLRVLSSFCAEPDYSLRDLIERKIQDLGHYNVASMDRAVAICAWGRSGSMLLASYLDGHDNVLMLPTLLSQPIFEFFERYQSLSLWEKLIAYPFFASEWNRDRVGPDVLFFRGKFPVAASEYYAAVSATFEVYRSWPLEFLESRRVFFRFLHVTYNLALGRRPRTPQPLMVYAQHTWDELAAKRFVEDFPEGRFVHTVRDPISGFDRFFDAQFRPAGRDPEVATRPSQSDRPFPVPFHITMPLYVIRGLLKTDGLHAGMGTRTRAIRFEDLHCDTKGTMIRLVDWLGLPFQDALLESTFNGTPYVVERNGKVWSGREPEQAQRHRRNLSLTDRALLFALMYDNFANWNYPCPRIFHNRVVRGVTCLLLLPVPTRMEVMTARVVLKLQVLPALRRGHILFVLNRMVRIVYCRLAIMSLVFAQCFRRLRVKKEILRTLDGHVQV